MADETTDREEVNHTDTVSRRDAIRLGIVGASVLTMGCNGRTVGQMNAQGSRTAEPTEPTPEAEPWDSGRSITSAMDLAFEDTFDEAPLDTSKWLEKYPWKTRTHNYDGYAASENAYVYDGNLVVEAEDQPQEGKSYTTGVASTREEFGPGYFEAVVKAPPTAPGFWPALWMTPAYEWPPEIDIFEFFGEDPRARMTYHYLDDAGNYQEDYKWFGGADFDAEFHVYGLDWHPERIVWYIDGVERFRFEGENVTETKMQLIFNFGIGAPFLSKPDPDRLPAVFEMDKIRIWQR